ncbi:MAG: hypothetical protein ABR608_04815 [Pseudonocardiaceae bacterium]
MHRGLRAAVPALLLTALATPALAAAPPAAHDLCAPTDPSLAELSGLATDGRRWFAVSDGGTSLRVLVLNPADCTVLDQITAEVNPYDVEDLALAPDGALWLADTGDNDLDRRTVALHRLTLDGDARLYRLTYPDGPHDAEALLLDRAGVPYLVTKELGAARVYRPAGALTEAGPTPLELAATVRIKQTDTPGGLVGQVGSVLVTGGAVSADGEVVALRTYTDAYLFRAPGGDVLAALASSPVRIPLPDEPQGEALALAPDGTLLSASEEHSASEGPSGSEGGVPVRAVPGATALLAPPAPVAEEAPDVPGDGQAAVETAGRMVAPWQTAAVVGCLVAVLAWVVRRRRRVR